MDTISLFVQIDRLVEVTRGSTQSYPSIRGARAQVEEFLREFAGKESSFLRLVQVASGDPSEIAETFISILESFRGYIEAGLLKEISFERKAQLDVVSDFLEQAHLLLETKGVHPAAPIVLVGATLEEFLRTWVEAEGLTLGQRKPSLDSYAQVLLSDGKITKQDMKDITAWGGLRNHAAHGEWAEVSDKQRASLMLEGTNLFMRKYGV